MASPSHHPDNALIRSLKKRKPTTVVDYAGEDKNVRPTMLRRVLDKAGLDLPTLIVMFKGSIPPAVGISMYQSTTISSYFTTQGYVIPIISVLAVAILPRDKFIQTLVLNVLFICIACAISLLAIWSSVQARIHTSPPAAPGPVVATLPYNSSQSAVCAVWLFVNIWLVNLIRAKLPSFNLPVVIYCIFINSSLTTGPTIGTTAAAEAFVRELLLANLFGMGLATGVCLFIFPISSRMIVMGEFRRLIGLLRNVVRLQGEHLAALARDNKCATEAIDGAEQRAGQEETKPQSKKMDAPAKDRGKLGATTTSNRLYEIVGEIRRLAGKLYGDMVYAKRDVAWGKLDAEDFAEIFTLVYNITIPLVAISTSIMILEGDAIHRRQVGDKSTGLEEETSGKNQVWNDMTEQIHASFQLLTEPIDQGLEHAGICLEILPKPKKSKNINHSRSNNVNIDVEGHGGQICPGDEQFGAIVHNKVLNIYTQRGNILRTWLSERLLVVDEMDPAHSQHFMGDDALPRNQPQLWVSLYLEQLIFSAGEAIQSLIAFADRKVSDGTMNHKRLIFPCKYRRWRWLKSFIIKRELSSTQNPDILEANDVYYGDSYNQKKDPERLPPQGTWQHIGSGLCKVPKVLGSKESAFGFRVACAAMTVGILAFLEKTQKFFQDQRLLWAMFAIALGMTITSGQSIFGFCCRVGATFVAMVLSLAIWYIPDQKTPGIIVFLWLFIFIEYYFIKFPRLMSAVITTITTQLVIVGYELQVRKIGETVATHSGQPYYPIYLLGPYRLAVIAGGSLVAVFWTFFPCALTDRTWLRQDLSAMMYLLGNYFSVVSSTVESLLENGAGHVDSEPSPTNHLMKVRRKIFGKVMHLASSVESHIMWQRWEPSISGSFPAKTYKEVFACNTHITGYLMLMSYALTYTPLTDKAGETYDDNEKAEQEAAGAIKVQSESRDNRGRRPKAKVLQRVELTHHTVLSTLTMLSNALLSGQRLPPFFPMPRHYETARNLIRLSEIDTLRESTGHDNSTLSDLYSSKHGDLALRMIDLRQGRHNRDAKQVIKCDRRFRSGEINGASSSNPKVKDPLSMELRVYLLTQVCGALVCDELEDLARAVGRLVGIMDFSFSIDAGNGDIDVDDDKESQAEERPLSESSVAASGGKGKAVKGPQPSWS